MHVGVVCIFMHRRRPPLTSRRARAGRCASEGRGTLLIHVPAHMTTRLARGRVTHNIFGWIVHDGTLSGGCVQAVLQFWCKGDTSSHGRGQICQAVQGQEALGQKSHSN